MGMQMDEVRLIDANAFKRDLIDNYGFFPAMVMRALEKQPVVDAVEVVRCGKCCHFLDRVKIDEDYAPAFSDGICGLNGEHKDEDDFCSCGKRREENAAD
jgi:hypothetical protein